MGWRVQWNGLSPSTGISLTWPVAHILYTAHCPINVLCIVCVLHKIYQCPKYTLLVIQVFKGYCPLPIEYCQLPIASRQWLVSNCAQNPFSFTTAGVNFFLQVWLRFSSSCCWEGSQTAASTPTSHPGTSYFLFEFFLGFFFTFSLRHTMCIYQPRVCEGRKLIRE